MFKKVKSWLFPTIYKVVEIPLPRPSIEASHDLLESVRTLAAHPGFTYLLNKLKVQRAALETTLVSSRHASLRDVEFIQSGIFWTGWLQSQLELAVLRLRPGATRPASDEEVVAFQEALRTIETVGTPSTDAQAS